MLRGVEHLPVALAMGKTMVVASAVSDRLVAAGHQVLAGQKEAPSVSAGHMLVQLLLGLGVVVGLLYLGTKVVRGRSSGSGLGQAAGRRRGVVTLLGRQTLGKGVSVAVVKVGERAYLLGVTPTAVRRLGEADAAGLVELADAPGAASRAGAAGFGEGGARLAKLASGLVGRVSPRLADRLSPGGRDAGVGDVQGLASEDHRPAHVISIGTGNGSARITTLGGERPAPTWTSAIEHLRERTVRRG